MAAAFANTAGGDEWSDLRLGDLSVEYSNWLRRRVSLRTNLDHVHTPGVKAWPFTTVTENSQRTLHLFLHVPNQTDPLEENPRLDSLLSQRVFTVGVLTVLIMNPNHYCVSFTLSSGSS
jgi:hypothetical protein